MTEVEIQLLQNQMVLLQAIKVILRLCPPSEEVSASTNILQGAQNITSLMLAGPIKKDATVNMVNKDGDIVVELSYAKNGIVSIGLEYLDQVTPHGWVEVERDDKFVRVRRD